MPAKRAFRGCRIKGDPDAAGRRPCSRAVRKFLGGRSHRGRLQHASPLNSQEPVVLIGDISEQSSITGDFLVVCGPEAGEDDVDDDSDRVH